MSVYNNFKDYQDEIELAIKQNGFVEVELYSIIANIIREGTNGSKISLRDVSKRTRTGISERYYGDGGFPDFVVLERSKKSDADKLGCVEIKALHRKMNYKIQQQIKGHLDTFKRVLYTNGLVWCFYEENMEAEWSFVLGNYNNGKIIWNEDEECWNSLLKKLDSINWIVMKNN